MRSPDASWISYARWYQLSQEQQAKFAHICPDFVIELKSETDDLKTLQKKMREDWLENGCLLAWLIDPETETSYIYRADRSETIVNGFDKTLSGENVLDGFVLELIELKNL
jgi:Uma2 family endonuclease